MNEPLKLALGTLVRYAVTIALSFLLAKGFLTEEQVAQLTPTPETILVIVGIIGTVGLGIYTRLKGRLKQNVALQMPKGTTQEELKEAVKDQPLSAKLSTKPETPV